MDQLTEHCARHILPGAIARPSQRRWSCPVPFPEVVTITKVAGATLNGKRSRVIGRNSHRPVHGQEVEEPIVRLYTDAGVSGWGWSPATEGEAERLVGRSLDEVFSPETGTSQELLMFDFPLWDLAGRVL